MECTLCGGRLERCASCSRPSCSTALCTRCRDAQPEVHPEVRPAVVRVLAGSGEGTDAIVQIDWVRRQGRARPPSGL